MRIIKFRAWEKPDKKARFNGAMHYNIESQDYFHKWLFSDDYIIQQFTGLLDKNGKEIYEGDILGREKRPLFEKPDGTKEVAVVTWNEEEAGFCGGVSSTSIYFYINNPHPYEVIGNIYENKELLK